MLNIYQQNRPQDEADKNKSTVPKPAAHSDFRKYTDATGELRSKELERGIWFVSHRVRIYHLIIGAIGFIAAIFWIISLWKWAVFFIDWQRQKQALVQLSIFPNYTRLHARFSPQDLEVLTTEIFAGGVDKFDAVAAVVNPNKRHMVQFDYHFLVDGVPTEKSHAVLLPNETAMVAKLGLEGVDRSAGAELVLEKIQWTRISSHTVSNPAAFQAERLDFTVANFLFAPGDAGDAIATNRLTFDLTNNSPFGYVEPQFIVGLYNGDSLVGAMPFSLLRFQTAETRAVDLRSFVRDLRVSEIKLFPLINVYDVEVFLPPKA